MVPEVKACLVARKVLVLGIEKMMEREMMARRERFRVGERTGKG